MTKDSMIRLDKESGETKTWFESGYVPGEPVFVPAPSGKEEHGALLTIALHVASQSSIFNVLDAETLMPLARADLKKVFPYGFHGVYVP